MSESNDSRRAFVKRIAYVAPAVLTLAAAPEYAKAGSVKPDSWGGWQRDKPRDSDWDFGWGKNKGKDKGPKDKGDKKGGKGED